jgi:hypothetical protein
VYERKETHSSSLFSTYRNDRLQQQRKKRTHVAEGVDSAKKQPPRTFVFRRGKHMVRLVSTALCLPALQTA